MFTLSLRKPSDHCPSHNAGAGTPQSIGAGVSTLPRNDLTDLAHHFGMGGYGRHASGTLTVGELVDRLTYEDVMRIAFNGLPSHAA